MDGWDSEEETNNANSSAPGGGDTESSEKVDPKAD